MWCFVVAYSLPHIEVSCVSLCCSLWFFAVLCCSLHYSCGTVYGTVWFFVVLDVFYGTLWFFPAVYRVLCGSLWFLVVHVVLFDVFVFPE